MGTLLVDLDARIRRSPLFKATTVAGYFRKSSLDWWKPEGKNYREQLSAVRQWLKFTHPASVIEFGPGFGRVTDLLSRHKPEKLVLVEVNRRACSVLRRKFPKAELIPATFKDFFGSRTEGDRYDLAVAIGVLVHVPNIVDLMGNIHSVLRHNGLFISSITPLSWYVAQGKSRTVIHRGIDRDEFEKMVRRFFRIEDYNVNKNGQHITYLLRKKLVGR